MARNLYILAGVLLFFAAVSLAMALTSGHWQPGLPANGTLWKTSALLLALVGLLVAFLGTMTALFEQIDRRTEERRIRQRTERARPAHPVPPTHPGHPDPGFHNR